MKSLGRPKVFTENMFFKETKLWAGLKFRHTYTNFAVNLYIHHYFAVNTSVNSQHWFGSLAIRDTGIKSVDIGNQKLVEKFAISLAYISSSC